SRRARSRRTRWQRARLRRARLLLARRSGFASSSPDLRNDATRLVDDRATKRCLEGVVVAAVDANRMPAFERKALLDPARPVVRRAVVVDDDGRQRTQADPPCPLHGLPVAAFVELPGADEAEGA